MLDFMPIEYFVPPQDVPVLVLLVDDRYAFAINHCDQYDSHWVIQLPFKHPDGAHQGMIKEWAPLPTNYYHDRLLKEHKYGE